MGADYHNRSQSLGHWHDIAYWCLLAVACVVFLVMNVLTTFKEDDLAFSLIEGVWTPIDSLWDLARSHANHYVDSNGRTANLVASLFCGLLGKPFFNVCNTLVFGLLAHVLSVLTTGRRSLLALSMFLAMVGTCFPVPGETMLWLDGSCNYMWAILFSLMLAWYLGRDHDVPLSRGRAVALFLASFVAGSFNEATTFGFFAGWCLYYAVNRHRFDRTVALVLAGYLLGMLLIVASPGAWQRASSGEIVTHLALPDLLASRWYIFSEKMWRFYLPVAALAVGVVALFLRKGEVVFRSQWTYILLSLALVMCALGVLHERAYSPLVTVAFIIVVMALWTLLERWPRARAIIVVPCLLLAGFTFGRGLGVLSSYKAYDDQIVSEIKAAPRQVVLLERRFDGYSRFVKPMNYHSTEFFGHEVVYCGYYDKDNVQFVADSVYARFNSGRLLDGATVMPLKSDRPDVVKEILEVEGQDYMIAVLSLDTLPLTPQTARYYFAVPDVAMPPSERERRRNYGLVTDYSPRGFYPLSYQGENVLIFPKMDSATSRIVFPLAYDVSLGEVTISR